MNNKLIFTFAICTAVIFISYRFWNLYYILPVEKAQLLIQHYLDKKYEHQYTIVSIKKQYSKDLFKQSVGYTLHLMDSNKLKFGPVHLQFNEYQKDWVSIGGSDINIEHQKVTKN